MTMEKQMICPGCQRRVLNWKGLPGKRVLRCRNCEYRIGPHKTKAEAIEVWRFRVQESDSLRQRLRESIRPRDYFAARRG